MKILGNVERYLVLGIVVVIGTILVVAITGARDLEKERATHVAAKTGPGGPGGTGGRKVDANSPRRGGAKPAREASPEASEAPRPAPPLAVDPEIGRALRDQQAAIDGKKLAGSGPPIAPAPSDAVRTGDPGALKVADAPEVIDESRGAGPTPLKREDPLAAVTPPAPVVPNHELAPPAAATEYTYEVQKGDTLERIARAVWGDGQQWKEILAANPTIGDGHTIRPGDKLRLPKAPTRESAAVTTGSANAGTAAPSAGSSTAATTTSAGFKRVTTQDEYHVQKGDTLMSIAAANYGTKAAWRLIYDANSERIADKDRIKPGVVLKLPTN